MTLLQFLAWYGIVVLPNVQLSDNMKGIVKELRSHYDGDIVMTSNLRSFKKNKQVDGVGYSKHLCGKAIDIRIRGLSKKDVQDILDINSSRYRAIVEHDHIHIEHRVETCD
jgi:hypothetical protein